MKKLVVLVCLLTFGLTQAQEVKPSFEQAGDLVKATYFYKDGKVKEQGFFKNKKLAGVWMSYDVNGKKTRVARYRDGKKVGKWLFYTKDGVKEVNYKNNAIASVKTSIKESKVAVK